MEQIFPKDFHESRQIIVGRFFYFKNYSELE